MAPPKESGFDKWKETIDAAGDDAAWDGYDTFIKTTVNEYNAYLKGSTSFIGLNWKLVKAIVWTESGGPKNPAWKSRPMQIGNAGDPGLKALLSGKEGGELIIPPQILGSLNAQNAGSSPDKNIQAGVGYLLMRLANFDFKNFEDPIAPLGEYVVRPGDSFSAIAARVGSTVTELKLLNPRVHALQPKAILKVKKAKIMKYITGFKPINNVTVARLYNTGDSRYAEKLKYCLEVIGSN